MIALWLSRAPMLFFGPPGVFCLKLPKAFVPKGVGEEFRRALAAFSAALWLLSMASNMAAAGMGDSCEITS